MGRSLLDEVFHDEAAWTQLVDCWQMCHHKTQVSFGCQQAPDYQLEARGFRANAEWLEAGSSHLEVFMRSSLHSHDF